MTINTATGIIYWRPSDTGTYSVTVKVTDPSGLSATQSFKVAVTSKPDNNSSPRITSTPVTSATVGVPYSYDVNATDSNGDTLYFRLYTAPTGMTIDIKTGIISWIPTSSQTGSKSVTVEAVDSKGGKASQGFTCNVIAAGGTVNNPPVITSSPITSAYRNRQYQYSVKATDADGDTLNYELTTRPSGMAINSSTGLITWTPSSTGTYSVTVKVSDSKGAYVTQSFNLTVRYSSYGALPVFQMYANSDKAISLKEVYKQIIASFNSDKHHFTN